MSLLKNIISPKDGGGQISRWLRFKKEMVRRRWKYIHDFRPLPPISLFDFRDPDDAADALAMRRERQDAWKVADDRVIGGLSEAQASFIRTPTEYRRYLNAFKRGEPISREDGDVIDEDEAAEASEGKKQGWLPFIRFSGTIDTTIGLRSDVQRSGYAAIRSPSFPYNGADLETLYVL
jgi:hypothetical protein